MSVKLSNVSGNGSVKENSIFSYDYSEEVTSLEPSGIAGATSQISISAIAVDSEETDSHLDSKLLINNEMLLDTDDYGSVTFRVKNISKSLQAVSIVGNTIQSRLNVERTAKPQGGPLLEGGNASLYSAIIEYCKLVDITPVISTAFKNELLAVPVNFIGWKDIVWNKLKELCAGFSASVSENVGIEMLISNNNLIFRKAKQSIALTKKNVSNESISIESFETAKSVNVFNYNTSYGENQVFYDIANFDKSKEKKDKFQSSINDSMQVEAGETLRKRFTVNASFTTVNNPKCVEQITRNFPDPYIGDVNNIGEYVIVGSDDLPIKPDQWNETGGLVTVELVDENGEALPAGQIELVVKAPKATRLGLASDENELAFAPYKIGIESSGEGEYPALWLTGTGVFYDKQENIFLTGSSNEYTSNAEGPTVDNIFITNSFNLSSRGVAAAQANCGPKIKLNQELAEGFEFGEIGSMIDYGLNKYRVDGASFNPSSVSITASASLSMGEWNSIWSGLTFQSFNDKVLDPALFPDDALRFNEFSVIPKIGI
jgi:hypothetical protein